MSNPEVSWPCEECGKKLTASTDNECWYCGGNFCKDHIANHKCEV